MGMYDDVKCYYDEMSEEHKKLTYQTKDLGSQMDLYKIEKDGSLWKEEYDVEDRSDPKAEGLMRLAGCMTRVNKRFVQQRDYTGNIKMYDILDNEEQTWLQYELTYERGIMTSFQRTYQKC
jgi:hypothetical protein